MALLVARGRHHGHRFVRTAQRICLLVVRRLQGEQLSTLYERAFGCEGLDILSVLLVIIRILNDILGALIDFFKGFQLHIGFFCPCILSLLLRTFIYDLPAARTRSSVLTAIGLLLNMGDHSLRRGILRLRHFKWVAFYAHLVFGFVGGQNNDSLLLIVFLRKRLFTIQ